MTDRGLCLAGIALLLGASVALGDEQPRVEYLGDLNAKRTPRHTVVPAYPKRARRERIEGEVQVCFNVNRRGKPYRIAVRKSTHRVFEKAAIRAVRGSSYEPVPANQRLSGIKTCRTFRFHLEPVKQENGKARAGSDAL